MKILLWGGFGHLVLLGVHEQFLVQLFAGAQTGDLDLHIYARLVAVEAYQAVGQIHDLDRLAHVQHVDAAALRQTAGLQNELRGLGDGHKVADNIGMRDGHRAAALDLLLKQWDDAAVVPSTLPKRTATQVIDVAREKVWISISHSAWCSP